MDKHRHALELKSCYFVKVNNDDPKGSTKKQTKKNLHYFLWLSEPK